MWKPTIADSPRQNVQQGMPGHTHLSVDFLPCKMLNGTKGFSPFPDRRGMGDLLLRILGEHQGRFVSGEEIGRRVGTSRAAGWKQGRTLRRRGFGIEGARGAWYRLLGRPDVIEETEVLSALSSRSFWKSFTFFPVTDSTNSRAAEAAEEGAPDGTILCAGAQTGGGGGGGRRRGA